MILDVENNFITDIFVSKYGQKQFWLDINDVDEENHFVDNNGLSLTWTNWHVNEPDNKNGDEGRFIDLK